MIFFEFLATRVTRKNFNFEQNGKMEKSEEEIIKEVKEMSSNGLSSSFVFKWVRERVENPEIKERIMNEINLTLQKSGKRMKLK